jgi:uncharacterized SAM-binding protein YcdF (DUF218 family)
LTSLGLVKSVAVPGSPGFFALLFGLGVLLLYGREGARRWGRRLLVALLLLYLALALPPVSDALTRTLTRHYGSIVDRGEASGADVLVVLSNGANIFAYGNARLGELGIASVFSVMEAARLYQLLKPRLVVVSGGIVDPARQAGPEADVLRDRLIGLGVPSDHILLDTESRTTLEQGRNVATLLRARGVTRFVLVTSPEHTARAAAVLAAQGLAPIPSIANLRYTSVAGGASTFWPSRLALSGSYEALYEMLAMRYYRMRGWM